MKYFLLVLMTSFSPVAYSGGGVIIGKTAEFSESTVFVSDTDFRRLSGRLDYRESFAIEADGEIIETKKLGSSISSLDETATIRPLPIR